MSLFQGDENRKKLIKMLKEKGGIAGNQHIEGKKARLKEKLSFLRNQYAVAKNNEAEMNRIKQEAEEVKNELRIYTEA